MVRLFGLLLGFALLLAIGGAAAGYFWYSGGVSAKGPNETYRTFTVERGEGLATIGQRLETEGFVSDEKLLRIKARLDNTETAIKAGEYEIGPAASAADVLDILIEGKAILYTVTVPEGMTTAQIIRRLNAVENLTGDDLSEEGLEEGAYLPETYSFERGTSKADVLELMKDAQRDMIADLWPTRSKDIPIKSEQDALILASIVQKEAAGQSEYGNVASVFINRLNKGMMLQSDPTVHYGVNKGEPLYNARGQRTMLNRKHLATDTPYNTYIHPGLPPTPIANPGKGAIKAVLNPPETDYYYFVADGKGGTRFSRNLKEHNRAVADYKKYEREEFARERAEEEKGQ